MEPAAKPSKSSTPRVLVAADWEADPQGVLAACVRRSELQELSIALLVPAWLHGLDWAGDPYASGPCARRALAIAAAGSWSPTSALWSQPVPVSRARSVCHACEHALVANSIRRAPTNPLTEALGAPRTITKHCSRGTHRSLA
jgi:hypothetical protein